MIRFRSILFSGVLVLILGGISFAQDFTPRVGIAGNVSLNMPVLGLRTWFTQAPQFGVNIVYHRHARIEVEFEYHHARLMVGVWRMPSLCGRRPVPQIFGLTKAPTRNPGCVFTASWPTASSFLASNSTNKRLGLISHSGAVCITIALLKQG